MMGRLRDWWMHLQGEASAEDTASENEHNQQTQHDENDQELTDTRALIKDSRDKMEEADTRIRDYQERIRREYKKRLALSSGGRVNDRDR